MPSQPDQTPPRQGGDPKPTFPRWMIFVGGTVIVLAVIWSIVQSMSMAP